MTQRTGTFNPVERLRAALCRAAPQAAVRIDRDTGTGRPVVRAVYGDASPLVAGWDGAAYRVRLATLSPWRPLPVDPDAAAEEIAKDLREGSTYRQRNGAT
ncbi:hypothetical protein [Actinomadura spongiicola]|uniref:hypothetical protein n=1 Tax=Actinomadura spongiicola TaxID=2303421 RepID=UPI0011C1BE25|nr:hypothetical protein [Actinomadura spongiicola]